MLRSAAIDNILISVIHTLSSGFRTRASLLTEILALRHQLAILTQSAKKHPLLGKSGRFLWVWLSRWWPDWRNSLLIVKADTVLAWHRKGFGFIGHGRAASDAQPDRTLPVISRAIPHLNTGMPRHPPAF
jgi:hypothetical protein